MVESFLVQAFGEKRAPCTKCQKTAHEKSGRLAGYLECRTMGGLFGGICGNCKRKDHGRDCSHGEEYLAVEDARIQQAVLKSKQRTTRTSKRARMG